MLRQRLYSRENKKPTLKKVDGAADRFCGNKKNRRIQKYCLDIPAKSKYTENTVQPGS